jgi:hypothetical protein
MEHVAPVHEAVPPGNVGHAVEHDAPQLLLGEGFSHVPLQVSPLLDEQPHTPPEHFVPVEHTLPHFPQLLESD